MLNVPNFGNFYTRTFAEIFSSDDISVNSVDIFKSVFAESGIPLKITETNLETLFYLLYAKYGNSHIAMMDENQFLYKLQSIVFMYGPTWEKRLEIQDKLRSLTEDELRIGNKSIHNVANAPGTDTADAVDSTGEDKGEFQYLSGQNVTKQTKGKMEALAAQNALLEVDVTKEFLDKFKDLFLKIVQPYSPLWFETVKNSEEDF